MKNKKTDVFDYLEWRGDLLFQQSEFNEIDALILCICSYVDFSCVKNNDVMFFKDAAACVDRLPDEIKYNGPPNIEKSVELVMKAANTERYKNIGIFRFVNRIDEEKEMQFSAVTFILPDRTAFIAYRGTDNTLIGWKEDFNMSFSEEVPAQIEAAKYAERIAEEMDMPLRIGGHSKGGNLAIWAGTHLPLEYKSRIIRIYSNDGPGFSSKFLKSERYREVREKICSFVPDSSIVGVLMEHDKYKTIQSSNPSIWQHDPFSWLVMGKNFVYDEEGRSASGKQFEKIIDSWLQSMLPKEREELVDSIYDILSSSNAKTLDDLDNSKIKSLISMQKTYKEMGNQKQKQLIGSLKKVFFKGADKEDDTEGGKENVEIETKSEEQKPLGEDEQIHKNLIG